MRDHNRQFVIAGWSVKIHEDWKSYKISQGLLLYYYSTLPLEKLKIKMAKTGIC